MATYTKLQSGDWGLRGTPSELTSGATVNVTTKAGQRKQETVGKVLWTGNGVSIATIAGKGQSSSTYRRRRSYTGSTAYDHQCWACRDARRDGKEACDQCMFD